MSDIRFNNWLHQSGTGGVYQNSAGNIGIGTTVPRTTLDVVGVVSATTFSGNVNAPGNSTFDGSVGIGTDNPNAAKLDIRGSDNPLLKLTQTTSGIARLNIESETNDGYQYAGIGIGSATADAELMWTTLGFDVNVADSVRLRIPSSGDVQVLTGNLVIGTSGKGIDFSATADGSGTTDSELLDDYEEGTFTPGFGVSNGNITYSSQWGKYTKVGNVVYIWFRLVATNDANGALYYLTNLPFTAGGINGEYPGPCISNFYNLNIGSNATVLGGYWRHGETRFRFHSNGNNTNQLTPTLTASSSFEIRGEGFYPVS